MMSIGEAEMIERDYIGDGNLNLRRTYLNWGAFGRNSYLNEGFFQKIHTSMSEKPQERDEMNFEGNKSVDIAEHQHSYIALPLYRQGSLT